MSPGPKAPLRRRAPLCDAHDAAVPAVATVDLRGLGARWQVAVCAQHLAALEAALEGYFDAS